MIMIIIIIVLINSIIFIMTIESDDQVSGASAGALAAVSFLADLPLGNSHIITHCHHHHHHLMFVKNSISINIHMSDRRVAVG